MLRVLQLSFPASVGDGFKVDKVMAGSWGGAGLCEDLAGTLVAGGGYLLMPLSFLLTCYQYSCCCYCLYY